MEGKTFLDLKKQLENPLLYFFMDFGKKILRLEFLVSKTSAYANFWLRPPTTKIIIITMQQIFLLIQELEKGLPNSFPGKKVTFKVLSFDPYYFIFVLLFYWKYQN